MILFGFKRMFSCFPEGLGFQSDEEAVRSDLIRIRAWAQKARKKVFTKIKEASCLKTQQK